MIGKEKYNHQDAVRMLQECFMEKKPVCIMVSLLSMMELPNGEMMADVDVAWLRSMPREQVVMLLGAAGRYLESLPEEEEDL